MPLINDPSVTLATVSLKFLSENSIRLNQVDQI